MPTPGHKITIEIETDPNLSEAGIADVTWGDVLELIKYNTPYTPVKVRPLTGDIHSRGIAGKINITVRELHG